MRLHIPLEKQDDEIDITPMIDCVFLLVLFFMVTSSFIEEAKVFKIVLPKATQTTTVARDQADSISLTVDGAFFFREGARKEEEIPDLAALMERLRKRSEPRPVIIRCDARCEYRQFAQVKNAIRDATRDSQVETVIFEEVDVRPEK